VCVYVYIYIYMCVCVCVFGDRAGGDVPNLAPYGHMQKMNQTPHIIIVCTCDIPL